MSGALSLRLNDADHFSAGCDFALVFRQADNLPPPGLSTSTVVLSVRLRAKLRRPHVLATFLVQPNDRSLGYALPHLGHNDCICFMLKLKSIYRNGMKLEQVESVFQQKFY